MSTEDYVEIEPAAVVSEEESKQEESKQENNLKEEIKNEDSLKEEKPSKLDFTSMYRIEIPERPTEWGYTLIGKENMAVALEKIRKTDILLRNSLHFPWYPYYTRAPRYMEDTQWIVPSVRKWLPCAEVYANYNALHMTYDHFVRVAIANLKEVEEFDIETRDSLLKFADEWLIRISKLLQVSTLLQSRIFKDCLKHNGEAKRSSVELDIIASNTFLRWVQAFELFVVRANTAVDILEEFRTTGRVEQNDIDHLKSCLTSLKVEDQDDYDRILKLHEITEFAPVRETKDFTPEELVERDAICDNFKKSIAKAKSLLQTKPEKEEVSGEGGKGGISAKG